MIRRLDIESKLVLCYEQQATGVNGALSCTEGASFATPKKRKKQQLKVSIYLSDLENGT